MRKTSDQFYTGRWAMSDGDLDPPGTYRSIIDHPGKRNAALEIGIVHEHRFAFWFWNQWQRGELPSPPPDLVSIDWHKDLGFEASESLAELNTNDDNEVALYAWTQLNSLNDCHILAAARLGIIGNVYVLCKQDDPEEMSFHTLNGTSTVRAFHDVTAFVDVIQRSESVILDIDLDYFTTQSEYDDSNTIRVSRNNQIEMETLLAPSGEIISAVLPVLNGVTIAIEPEWCGGFARAHRLFACLNRILFDNTLLSNSARWTKNRTR